jgi:hypothetical protein
VVAQVVVEVGHQHRECHASPADAVESPDDEDRSPVPARPAPPAQWVFALFTTSGQPTATASSPSTATASATALDAIWVRPTVIAGRELRSEAEHTEGVL